MARAIAQDNGIACYDTFTGFRFLAQRMEQLEQAGAGEVIFSFEEAYGCMIGHHVRDKDGVSTAMLIGEMAAWYAGQNCSLYDALQALYTRYGWYGERTEQFYRTGQAGAKEIADFMTHLREAPPKQILGTRVVAVRDYLSDDQQSKERKRSAPRPKPPTYCGWCYKTVLNWLFGPLVPNLKSNFIFWSAAIPLKTGCASGTVCVLDQRIEIAR